MKANFKNILALLLIVGVVILLVSVFSPQNKEEEKFVYSDIVWLLENDLVKEFVVDSDYNITLTIYDHVMGEDGKPVANKERVTTKTYTFSYNSQIEEINELAYENYVNGGNLEKYDYEHPAETPWYMIYLPWIITAVIFIGLFIFMMRQTSILFPRDKE